VEAVIGERLPALRVAVAETEKESDRQHFVTANAGGR